MTNYIFALDLSITCTGVTVFDIDGNIVVLDSIRSSKIEKDQRKKIIHIAKSLLHLSEKYKPEKLIIEAGFFRFRKVTKALDKLLGVTEYIFNDVPIIEIAPTTIRKILLANGKANKDMVKEYIQQKYSDLLMENTDVSDSVAVGLAYFIREGIIV